MMRRVGLLSLALLPFVAACGSGDDEAADTSPAAVEPAATEPPATQAAVETTAAPVETTPPPATDAPAETPAPADTTAPADTVAPAAGGAIDIELAEWSLTASGPVAAGATTFNVTNAGSFPHEFKIMKGDSYATLPQTAAGAVDEAALPADAIVVSSGNIPGGGTATVDADLAAGNYVFVCNIAVGPNSHAKAGQTLDVTVA